MQKRMAYAFLCSNLPSSISTRDMYSQRSSPPSPISPTWDIEGQCPSSPSPISPTRDIEGQFSSPPSPITLLAEKIKAQVK
ncbi:hypothetical protein PoB_002279400 [Plakobranchus ocellatus]|uniref:Uncharacterized protein n=1 Tax=Plakobranchus ocellatus TaxID=259542 RepID=A0AAV3ZPJ0_9GAST|nr:hypothetical protein PoB_002279400 [Plakobranchus ocellatus]